MSEESKLLWQQSLFQAEARSLLKIIEQQRYHEHGRLVPEMPTDDGALLAESSDAILCRGAPYQQDQFAHGLNVHVDPAAGWQPPPSPCQSQPQK
jgi:hypothetical protein